MTVYRYQPVITPGPSGTDYRPFCLDQELTDLCLLDNYRYVFVTDISAIIVPDEITFEEVTITPELREIIKINSPHTQLIAQRVIDQIRAKYPLDEELYFARIAVGALQGSYQLLPGEAEAIAQYQTDVEAAREWGRVERAKIGL
jgi:hypothetical protein